MPGIMGAKGHRGFAGSDGAKGKLFKKKKITLIFVAFILNFSSGN